MSKFQHTFVSPLGMPSGQGVVSLASNVNKSTTTQHLPGQCKIGSRMESVSIATKEDVVVVKASTTSKKNSSKGGI